MVVQYFAGDVLERMPAGGGDRWGLEVSTAGIVGKGEYRECVVLYRMKTEKLIYRYPTVLFLDR